MVLLKYTVILIITVVPIEARYFNKSKVFKINDEACKKLAQKPNLRIEMIVGKRWMIYYAWNLIKKTNDKCMEMSFKNATNRIVNRIWNDMYEYLENQPPWRDASLLMSMTARHEMLLFSDDMLPGKFIGVANVMRSENIPPKKKNSVPLFDVHLKLFQGDRYLVVSDCNVGISTLSIRNDALPRGMLEIQELATNLTFGHGSLICSMKMNIQESFESDILVKGLN